jgi:hypothetical protein
MEKTSCKKEENDDLSNNSEVKNETNNELKDNNSNKNITSKKPIKIVENIYYFTPPC